MPSVVDLALLALLFAPVSDYQSAERKIELIEKDQAPPNSRVVLTSRELNAYARHEAPPGVRNVRLDLGTGSATGSADIDFLKVSEAKGGSPPNPLLAGLLEGERPVRVTARMRSGDGRATIDVTTVEISGISISGRALDFLIQHFLLPAYPDAKIGEPFELGHRIDRIEVQPTKVDVVIGK